MSQSIFPAIPSQSVVTQLWVDANTTIPTDAQNGSIDHPYNTVQQAIDFSASSSLVLWHIKVAFGIYPGTITVPPNKRYVIEGPVRAVGGISLGPINWTVTGNNTSSIVFRFIIVGKVTVIDDVIPATSVVLAYLACNGAGVETTGTSVVNLIWSGTSLASFTAVASSLPSSVVTGFINIGLGLILADNVQFAAGCTSITCATLLAHGCSFSQDINLSSTAMEVAVSVWLASGKTVTFTGSSGQIHFDEHSIASFVEHAGIVINGERIVATQRSTGWLSGGVVTRTTGRSVNVTAGTGYVFDSDDITDYVAWNTAVITLTANQLSDIYIDDAGVVNSDVHPVNERNVIVLATAYSNSSEIVLLSEGKIETTQIVPQISAYVKAVIGPIHVNGLAATIYSPPSLQLSVDSGQFYINLNLHNAVSNAPITFTLWYRDGSGGVAHLDGQTSINPSIYDDSSGTPAALLITQWKKDLLYVSVGADGTEYHVVLAQQFYNSQSAAEAGNLPATPDALVQTAMRCGGIVSHGLDTQITSIVDERPRLGQFASGSTAVTDHGLLSGLGDDDHPQYQLRTEKDVIDGYTGFDGFLLENDPPTPNTNYSNSYSGSFLSNETWKRVDTSNLKTVDYTFSGGKLTTEIRKVYATNGTTIVAQLTIAYTYTGNKLTSYTSTRNV